MLQENVVQPLLVSMSAIRLASECVRSILKIDDVVSGAGLGILTWITSSAVFTRHSFLTAQVNAR